MKDSCVVLLSGGMDSTICLHLAMETFNQVHPIAFNYFQRHSHEIRCAEVICSRNEPLELKIFETEIFKDLDDSSLVSTGDVNTSHKSNPNLPSSFVPGRNIFFLTVAGMYAYKMGCKNIIIGVSEEDFSGYPDCRGSFIYSMEKTLNEGLDTVLVVHAPLLHITKAQELELALNRPKCWEDLAYTNTCYYGEYPPCGKCNACLLRAKAFKEISWEDPLIKREREER